MNNKLPVSALILAGGKGERIGGNKLFLSLDGAFLAEPLVEKMSRVFDEITLCVGNGESDAIHNAFHPIIQYYSVNLIEDRSPGRGPIEGLRMGLQAMSNEWSFLIGCDMPRPQEAVMRYIWNRTLDLSEEYKVSAARIDGHLMPLHAFYHKDCTSYIDYSIEQAESECGAVIDTCKTRRFKERSSFNSKLKLKSFYDRVRINVVEENELSIIPGWRSSFRGFNTDKELKSMYEF
ncbi:MAG: molybdenum cofactor guanylyltransferase [Synergistaceae bacterium]|nr:molybdenum cofactor guanylyltransferase [Synergistaceae bacterium]